MFFSRAPGGLEIVTRTGLADWDWTETDLTLDGTVRTLDVSSVVPADAKLALFRVQFNSSQSGRFVLLGHYDETTSYAMVGAAGPDAGNNHFGLAAVEPNPGQQVKYWASSAGITAVYITCIGWAK